MLFAFSHHSYARQVEGRTTIPSDCSDNEVWVRDHSKTTGEWSAYCRTRTGGARPSHYGYMAPRFKPDRPSDWPTPYQSERSTNWQSKEVQDLLWSIERIPSVLWNKTVHGIYRMHRSLDYPNPGMYWNNHIVLYDSAFQNEEYTARVLAHELAHANFDDLSELLRKDYAKAAGWKRRSRTGGNDEWIPPGVGAVVPAGLHSIDEHFASSVEYFIFDNKKLKKINPGVFTWVQKYLTSTRTTRRPQ